MAVLSVRICQNLMITTVFLDTRLLENKTPAETFPKFPSVLRVIDRSDRNPPITATSMTFTPSLRHAKRAVIGEFRSDLSITCMIDGNFGNVSAGVLFSKVAYQGKRW